MSSSLEQLNSEPTNRLISEAKPLVRRLPSQWDSEYCFRRLSQLHGCVWLDSSLQTSGIKPASTADSRSMHQAAELCRYSYLAADPFSIYRIDRPHRESLAHIHRMIQKYAQEKFPELPPMQGGWMGWFGYELGQSCENVPVAENNEFRLPAATLGLYDVVLSWDHQQGQAWLVSQGWPYTDPLRRQEHAYERLQFFLDILESTPEQLIDVKNKSRFGCSSVQIDPSGMLGPKFSRSSLATQYPTRWSKEWTSNFSSEQFRAAVARCVEYIRAGDAFQINLAQRLLCPARCSSAELALHLRKKSPAPFSGYADFGRVQVISSSPERFLSSIDGRVESRPIKGTRPRLSDPVADAGMAELLRASEKDRSENVMIADLIRNDLSRIATDDSVKVTALCEVEKYPFVWHLVSVIEAQLRSECSVVDVLAATFPGGSITGAPKIRAMEIIAELEPTVRGPYCGSLGYISFDGDMDLSILIRTVTACDGWWQVPVGGGIVIDSEPTLEEQEAWHKAEGILRAIDSLPT